MSHIVSIAPMMGWTDRHARYFLRLITRRSLLYTEMLTTGAILHGARETLLRFHPAEHPLAIQLGGSDPGELAACSRIAEQAGFDEINLNVGCPSGRVQSGSFGACLMAQPERVAECVAAMRNAVQIPVTVKCRIGVDHLDSYDAFAGFVGSVAQAGCDTFIVHARKAWLQGLNPKQNRELPPLKYDYVYRLKREWPQLTIVINGGIRSHDEMDSHLQHVDGVMLGREAYHNPFMLSAIDARFYGCTQPARSREAVVEALVDYIETERRSGARLHDISRHIHGLYHGVPGARAWRRRLSTQALQADADTGLIRFGDAVGSRQAGFSMSSTASSKAG